MIHIHCDLNCFHGLSWHHLQASDYDDYHCFILSIMVIQLLSQLIWLSWLSKHRLQVWEMAMSYNLSLILNFHFICLLLKLLMFQWYFYPGMIPASWRVGLRGARCTDWPEGWLTLLLQRYVATMRFIQKLQIHIIFHLFTLCKVNRNFGLKGLLKNTLTNIMVCRSNICSALQIEVED